MSFFLHAVPIHSSIFFELSLVIAIAVLMAIIMRLLRQPLIVSYILTGLIVGPFFLNFIQSTEIFELFGEIGISILLFTVGLNLSPELIKQFGKISLLTGAGQVLITSGLGFFLARLLGYDPLTSGYIGTALAFASTIITLKLLSDRNELETLHAKVTIGFLIIQDLLALILLFSVPIIANADVSSFSIITMLIKGIIMVALIWIIAHKLLRPLNNFFSHSQELLFLFSLSWGFVIAAIFKFSGFSLETGALIAGISLAALPARHEITARLTPLRDFFIVIFFILLGAQIAVTDITTILPKAVVFSLLILIINPLIILLIMKRNGYRKKTSFKTALAITQLSEFSLILVGVGASLGHLNTAVVSTITLVGLITIFISSYLILHADSLYELVEPWLTVFEQERPKEPAYVTPVFPIMLFGCNRIGHDFVETFKKEGKRFLVIDYSPETIEDLRVNGVETVYGDASDIGFLQDLNMSKLELVVSTIPHLTTNIVLTDVIRQQVKKPIIMAVAHTIDDALLLYKHGVDYVILPHFLGGQYAADMIVKLGTNRRRFTALKQKHITYLNSKRSLGHNHPHYAS